MAFLDWRELVRLLKATAQQRRPSNSVSWQRRSDSRWMGANRTALSPSCSRSTSDRSFGKRNPSGQRVGSEVCSIIGEFPRRPTRGSRNALHRHGSAIMVHSGPTRLAALTGCGNLTAARGTVDVRVAVPQTALILVVTRHYSSQLLNFVSYSPEITNATEDPVLPASNGPDRRDCSRADRRILSWARSWSATVGCLLIVRRPPKRC
jgi:hypothetical protein